MGISELIRRSPDSAKDEIPTTPEKKKHASDDNEEASAANGPATETVRRRRGYRPLSVFTPSMFFPFDGETAKAIALLDEHRVDEPVSTPSRSPMTFAMRASKSSDPSKVETCLEPPEALRQSSITSLPLRKHERSPSKTEIKCSYSGLMFLPPPDPSQHPAFQVDPFTSVSESPNLICTSTADEIRQLLLASHGSRSSSFESATTPSFGGSFGSGDRTSGSSETKLSDGKRRVYIPDYIRSPDPMLGKKGFSARMDGSPLAGRFQEIVIPASAASLPELAESDRKRAASGSLRKLSDMFKAKLSGERSSSSSASAPETFEEKSVPFLEPRSTLEAKLRATTYSPSYSYQSNSVFPRHPATGRSWKSRNLKCTTCFERSCSHCSRACCAFRASVMALEKNKDDVASRAEALQQIHEITMVYPYGKEAPTFLRCSEDSGTGCGRLLCPDCYGQCPDPSCKDIQCYQCKEDPWGFCAWHDSSGSTVARSTSVTTDGLPMNADQQ